MDIKTAEERSCNMSKIRSKNTKPELFIRSLLHQRGFRFRVSYDQVIGKPDLFFPCKRVAVFIHGCYWHRHKCCKYAYTPKSHTDFWQKKFAANVLRDSIVKDSLHERGIRILVIWECTIKNMVHDSVVRDAVLDKCDYFLQHPDEDYLEL